MYNSQMAQVVAMTIKGAIVVTSKFLLMIKHHSHVIIF